MRVVVCADSTATRSEVLEPLLEAFREAGHAASLVTFGENPSDKLKMLVGGRWVDLPLAADPLCTDLLAGVENLAAYCANIRADLVHVSAGLPLLVVAQAAQKAGCPYAVAVDGPREGAGGSSPVLEVLLLRSLRAAASVFCLSGAAVRAILATEPGVVCRPAPGTLGYPADSTTWTGYVADLASVAGGNWALTPGTERIRACLGRSADAPIRSIHVLREWLTTLEAEAAATVDEVHREFQAAERDVQRRCAMRGSAIARQPGPSSSASVKWRSLKFAANSKWPRPKSPNATRGSW
jgi:hypothetical protein